jgi:hypothetical protein
MVDVIKYQPFINNFKNRLYGRECLENETGY